MITLDELKRRSGQLGVDVTVLEKDYCLGWFLRGFSENSVLHENLAFKGATAIKKTYFPHHRFSEDLDFTSKKDFTGEILKKEVTTVCNELASACGFNYSLANIDKKREAEEGKAWELRVEFIGPRGQAQNPRRVKLDITTYEKILQPLDRREIHHPYSDQFKAIINTYALDEILAEKLRTILQRGYPRDIYDVWFVLKYGRVDDNLLKDLFSQKCAYKNVPFQGVHALLEKIDAPHIKAHWEASLARQLTNLPDLLAVREDLTKTLKKILPS
jgi:predicted nucleotidyltransferase component of viral defense system